MKPKGKIFRCVGRTTMIRPKDLEKGFLLKEIYDVVGSPMQCLLSKVEVWILIVNEEAKDKKLMVNKKATDMYIFGKYDEIRGDAIFCPTWFVK